MYSQRYRHMQGMSMSSMKKASFEIALKGKKQIAEGTIAFIFEKPEGFVFKAGQHLRMTLINPPETDVESDSRFFSLASTLIIFLWLLRIVNWWIAVLIYIAFVLIEMAVNR